MLHGLYKEIKCCTDDRIDVLSQKITMLQAINIKDKSCIPGYLQYHDRGFMYFPDPVFLPYLREVDSILKKVINSKGLNEHGDELIKVNCKLPSNLQMINSSVPHDHSQMIMWYCVLQGLGNDTPLFPCSW